MLFFRISFCFLAIFKIWGFKHYHISGGVVYKNINYSKIFILDTSALFLAARSFTRPFEYISQHETKRMVQGYLAYINDNTKLINNPVIKVSYKYCMLLSYCIYTTIS